LNRGMPTVCKRRSILKRGMPTVCKRRSILNPGTSALCECRSISNQRTAKSQTSGNTEASRPQPRSDVLGEVGQNHIGARTADAEE
jgi:hypothetical protein